MSAKGLDDDGSRKAARRAYQLSNRFIICVSFGLNMIACCIASYILFYIVYITPHNAHNSGSDGGSGGDGDGAHPVHDKVRDFVCLFLLL